MKQRFELTVTEDGKTTLLLDGQDITNCTTRVIFDMVAGRHRFPNISIELAVMPPTSIDAIANVEAQLRGLNEAFETVASSIGKLVGS